MLPERDEFRFSMKENLFDAGRLSLRFDVGLISLRGGSIEEQKRDIFLVSLASRVKPANIPPAEETNPPKAF